MTLYNNVLIIHLSALGDVLRASGFIRTLKQTQPNCKIYVLTNHCYADIFEFCPDVTQTFRYHRKRFAKIVKDSNKPLNPKLRSILNYLHNIRKIKFDKIYDFNCNNETILLATILSNFNPDLINNTYMDKDFTIKSNSILWFLYDYSRNKYKFNPLCFSKFLKLFTDSNIKYSKGAFDIKSELIETVKIKLHGLGIDYENKIFAIQMGAGEEKKRWQYDRAAEFIRYLNKTFDNPVILMGDEIERQYYDRFIIDYKVKAINVAGTFSLLENVAVISICNFLLTMDTYAMHAASELNKQFLALEFKNFYLPAGSENSYIYLKKDIKANEVIKIFEKYFFQQNYDAKLNLEGTLYKFDPKSLNNYYPVINNNTEEYMFDFLKGMVYTISFLKTFNIKNNITLTDIRYYVKQYETLTEKNLNKIVSLINEIKIIRDDLTKKNTEEIITLLSKLQHKQYIFIDLIFPENKFRKKYNSKEIIFKQCEFLDNCIELLNVHIS